ncbi:GNAT family N-acetyltransferase [Marinilabilia salmonicolor]|uniref:Putative N-acetyltransferase YhbS n=1 Tax=Marinilabilia salmonicolor TaxID=989 RepID=A0A368UQZ0_9BACT|nr:N-acetyltransferase [Marinilabilia salmonicolor]RCW29834.1 putative N-acetyltransferase YhbS [Marinilabilia salmonicolor]
MKGKEIKILQAKDADLKHILFVDKTVFGSNEKADLTARIIKDNAAQPVVTFLAFDDQTAVGYAIFANAEVDGWHQSDHVSILAPLAVIPEYKDSQVNKLLIEEGIKKLKQMGTEMVFTFGNPEYYKKFGFVPEAESFGFAPPATLTNESREKWMVQALTLKGLSKNVGSVVCSESMNKPEFWGL